MSRLRRKVAGELVPHGMDRMAPGGMLWSESPVTRRSAYGAAGEYSPPPPLEAGAHSFLGNGWWSDDSFSGTVMASVDFTAPEVADATALIVVAVGHHIDSFTNVRAHVGGVDVGLPYATRLLNGTSSYARWAVWSTPWDGQAGRLLIDFNVASTGTTQDRLAANVLFKWTGAGGTPRAQSPGMGTGASGTWPAGPFGWSSPIQVLFAAPAGVAGDDYARIDDLTAYNVMHLGVNDGD